MLFPLYKLCLVRSYNIGFINYSIFNTYMKTQLKYKSEFYKQTIYLSAYFFIKNLCLLIGHPKLLEPMTSSAVFHWPTQISRSSNKKHSYNNKNKLSIFANNTINTDFIIQTALFTIQTHITHCFIKRLAMKLNIIHVIKMAQVWQWPENVSWPIYTHRILKSTLTLHHKVHVYMRVNHWNLTF